MVTKQLVAKKLTDYLQNCLSRAGIVDWAEQTMLEAEFADEDFEILREIVSRLGLADVAEFGLSWEDCAHFLLRLGYQVRVEVLKVA